MFIKKHDIVFAVIVVVALCITAYHFGRNHEQGLYRQQLAELIAQAEHRQQQLTATSTY